MPSCRLTKEADDKLMLMEGWAPAETKKALEKMLDDKGFITRSSK